MLDKILKKFHVYVTGRFIIARSAPFLDITLLIVVIPCRRFKATYRTGLFSLESLPLKMEPIGCTETSVGN
jgi:hypothetical protein